MCGIGGVWGDLHGPPDEHTRLVTALLAAMDHRGPDGQGQLAFAGGAAGMVRLALVDLSERGQQPIWSPDGQVAILLNGEIYDFRSERARLAAGGYPFISATDTEVALALYLEHGTAFASRLRGMFAIAILDFRDRGRDAAPVLVLARDRFGIKPLYVHERGEGGLAFASEMRALVRSGAAAGTVDRDALSDYLAYGFVLGPHSMIEGVRLLEPGTVERHAVGEAPRAESFALGEPEVVPGSLSSLPDAAARLREVLDESVALHAFADAPVGAFLSGGIDSTAIVGLMRPHVRDLRTYSLRLVDNPALDESAWAMETARSLGCEHTLVEVTDREVAARLPEAMGSLDQPSIDGFNTWLVSRAAARDVKGVLSGLGGDELFSGYPVVGRMVMVDREPAIARAGALAATVATRTRLVPAGRLRGRAEALAARRSPVATWAQAHHVFSEHERARLLGSGGSGATALTVVLDRTDAAWHERSSVALARLLDTRVYMGNQLLRDSDATSMAHSLELRVPLVDAHVAEVAYACADELHIGSGAPEAEAYGATGAKRVLIEAVRDLLPVGIEGRRKQGFVLPYRRWIDDRLRDLTDDACAPGTVSARGLLDPRAVTGVLERARRGGGGARYPQAWSLLALELWCRATFD